jgi:threonine dehydratase
LISGVSLGLVGHDGVRVAGVVAAASPAMLRAYETGRLERVDIAPTLADGLAGNLEQGTVTLELARERVTTMVAVTEHEIADAIRLLAFEYGIVAEGSGAVGVAAVRTSRIDAPAGGTTVVLVTGRNIAPPTLAAVLGG